MGVLNMNEKEMKRARNAEYQRTHTAKKAFERREQAGSQVGKVGRKKTPKREEIYARMLTWK